MLGVAYKSGVGDLRESPAVKIIRSLRELGADVAYHDPHVPELPEFSLASAELETELGQADLVVIVTAHPEVDYERVVREAALVLDFRGVTRGIGREEPGQTVSGLLQRGPPPGATAVARTGSPSASRGLAVATAGSVLVGEVVTAIQAPGAATRAGGRRAPHSRAGARDRGPGDPGHGRGRR